MAIYAASNLLGGSQQNMTTTFKTLLALTAATATLTAARIIELICGTDGAPNDTVLTWDVSRQTAAGTSTAVTPNPVDPGNRAAGTVATANFTAEGTITAASSVLGFSLNQRATQRWLSAGPEEDLVIPATNLAGFAVRAKSATYALTAVVQALFRE